MHFEPTMQALDKGYHILLEKPMSADPIECLAIEEQVMKSNRILSVCHVSRYTPFFATIKRLLAEGKIGRLIAIQHNENVGYFHQAHSFVRGNWRNSKQSSPMILAKSCHDMDILLWLADAECERISSFGSLTHFKKENAPEGAPLRCLDGCPAENECPYYAPKLYFSSKTEGSFITAISNDTTFEAREKALREGPYGRCVYHCDNDVVDHQVVNMEFANEVTAAFIMCAFTKEISRTIKLMGTMGEMRGALDKNEIEITDFNSGTKEIIHLSMAEEVHSGGDSGIMRDFVRLVRKGENVNGLTNASVSVQSHLMAIAAETSRVEKRTIEMKPFMKDLRTEVK